MNTLPPCDHLSSAFPMQDSFVRAPADGIYRDTIERLLYPICRGQKFYYRLRIVQIENGTLNEWKSIMRILTDTQTRLHIDTPPPPHLGATYETPLR